MFYRLIGFCFMLALLSAPTYALGGDEVPAWLKQAAAASAPTYKKDVPAVVLNDESNVIVGDDGRITTVTTYAVRVLTREGRASASAVEHYETDTGGKVREMRAWLIHPDGSTKKYGKDETIDVAASLDDLYSESRLKSISAVDDAEVGAVFGYQTTTEDHPLFPQTVWAFQGRLPSLVSRFTLTLPAGWRASSVTFNTAKIEPAVSGTSYTWEMRNLSPIEPEPSSPSVLTLAPHVAVSYVSSVAGGRTFDKWLDVSRWYTELADPQAAPDDAIATKARELTANAKTEMEKIQAIGRYVQNLQYVSIQIGIGGYRPHAATSVFAKQYGDCKDKANLMRAMLRAVKLTAYPVLIYAGDRTHVREEWASPMQFNHCIVAVKVSDETQAASVIQHPTLGRLLIFDATDESTSVGDLPDHEQGSFALVAAGETGALIRMPVTEPDGNRLDRQVEMSLAEDGSIAATVHERMIGQSAANARRDFKGLSRAQYTKAIEDWVSLGATGAKFNKIEPADSRDAGRFALDVEFTVDRYAQSMQDRLLVFKPAVVSRGMVVSLTEPTRTHPVVLKSRAYTETTHIKLPAGFDVDEMPDALKLDSAFGNYSATYEVKDGQLVFTRSLVQRQATIPAEQYDQLRKFFGRIRATEESPVVLARK
ncbi:MAG: DUF3857 domain-containing protein [Acidobacteria bacterium]|nr:DUF3857 domain-containing protein [Acidobacteriota bacterium]